MTPLEKAAGAVGRVELWDGDRCVNVLTEDECRQIAAASITAFLEAAMRDDNLCLKVASGFAMQAAVASMSFERERDIRVARAAILALKETINGP